MYVLRTAKLFEVGTGQPQRKHDCQIPRLPGLSPGSLTSSLGWTMIFGMCQVPVLFPTKTPRLGYGKRQINLLR